MIKRDLIFTAFILFCLFPLNAQVKKQDSGLKREVTLYNPYKPSLPESKKKSYLPDMNDTSKVKPDFRYDVSTKPFMPTYTVSPIKAASLLPDPLTKLYKSYIKIGMGYYYTPLAELSITNERSKKGTFGFYGRHFSSSPKLELDNGKKVFAGYMDNDASLFGRKFFRKSLFESSVDFSQKVRHAYGYSPAISDYSPDKKDIRLGYENVGAKASLSSTITDSTIFNYKVDGYYNYFYNAKNLFQHSAGIKGIMAKLYEGFYIGAGISLDYYKSADSIAASGDIIYSISPFVKKSKEQWSFKIGFQALSDRVSQMHIYPDVTFDFNIVPSYVTFYSALSGKLERNDPWKIISENPYVISNQYPGIIPNYLFGALDTDNKLIVLGGLKGNTGLSGNYNFSASYSMVDDMLFYSNFLSSSLSVVPQARGNYFVQLEENINVLNLHGELAEKINDKLSIAGKINYFNYSGVVEYWWNKPNWDGQVELKYNLRDKIIAGMEITAIGKRKNVVNGGYYNTLLGYPKTVIDMNSHLNVNLSAEYRYSKILSFWTKFNNLSFDHYYEWAYYPTERFLFMLGFTYSL